MRPFLVLTFAVFLTGCLASDPAPKTTAPSDSAESIQPPGVQTFVGDFNLTTYGSIQAAGKYVHPGQGQYTDLQNRNCVAIEISGSEIRHLNATAEWTGGDRLVLFQRLKDYGVPGHRNTNHTIGQSPLNYVFDYPAHDGATWLFVGIEPAPDAPASVGAERDNITLHVEIDYVGEDAPTMEALEGCAYDVNMILRQNGA